MSGREENPIRRLFLEAFRLSEGHFDVWRRHLNAGIAEAGGQRVFSEHERQLAITHFVMLSALLDEWMKAHNPLVPSEDETFGEAVMTLRQLQSVLSDRYTPTTIRKNFIELKHLGLVEQRERGEKATVHLHPAAIDALRATVLEWIESFGTLAVRLKQLS